MSSTLRSPSVNYSDSTKVIYFRKTNKQTNRIIKTKILNIVSTMIDTTALVLIGFI